MTRRSLKLGAVLVGVGDGGVPNLWRDPAVPTDASVDLDWYTRQARQAEAAGFDFVFLVDSQYVEPDYPHHHLNRLEPLTLLSALAARTDRIGLVATVSTTYAEPWDIARKVGSLDLISRGRAGWNIVTSIDPGTAGNFGRDAHEDYPTRYRRAQENVEVVTGLWDSYEPDAFSTDRTAPRFLDPAKQHRLDHVGEFYTVGGPLNLVASRQGRPVLVQAGASEPGRELSARVGEVIFNFCRDAAEGKDFADDVRGRLAAYGRSPEEVIILPAASIVIADTDEQAQQIAAERRAGIDLAVPLFQLRRTFGGHDFARYDLDAPFPLVDASTAGGALSGAAAVAQDAVERGLTLREVLLSLIDPHWATFVGSPRTIADELEGWYVAGAADGFNVFVHHPGDFDRFTAEVVPELVARGVVRDGYLGATLRDHLELAVPVNRHLAARGDLEPTPQTSPELHPHREGG